MGTIEWIYEWYVVLGPGRKRANAMFAQAESVLRGRIGKDVNTKDLFYYIVSLDFATQVPASELFIRTRRKTPLPLRRSTSQRSFTKRRL